MMRGRGGGLWEPVTGDSTPAHRKLTKHQALCWVTPRHLSPDPSHSFPGFAMFGGTRRLTCGG